MCRHYKGITGILLLFAVSCGQLQNDTAKMDTPTSGSINISSDDQYKRITQAELDAFQGLYTDAKIRPVYCNEDSAFGLLLKDSVRLIIANRKLTAQEAAALHSKQLKPEEIKVGSDAVVLVVNNNNTDTLLTLTSVKDIFNGKDSLWSQISKRAQDGKISVVFDHGNSSNIRYVQQNLANGHDLPAYCFAMHNNEEVIDYVSKNQGAIGVIGLNCISNEYDSTTINFLKRVKVVSLSNSTSTGDYYKPWPMYIQSGQYPLSRDIYIISREPYTGLGSGFLSFVTSDKGQRVIYREGLLPIRIPSHNIHF